ncbi:MAG: hypothetical protein JNL58_22665 [Planctomyces sp.]|nr:hypothetical protein [Planctomyces sp.]
MSKSFKINPMTARGTVQVSEPGRTATKRGQLAIEAFESALFSKDRAAVLNRKLFAIHAAEFLAEIIRSGAATPEAIAQAEPERFEEILKQLPKDHDTRTVLQPARAVSGAAAGVQGLKIHPPGSRMFRDAKRGTSTNEEMMLEATVIGADGKKQSEIRTLRTWGRWIALIDAFPEIRERVKQS